MSTKEDYLSSVSRPASEMVPESPIGSLNFKSPLKSFFMDENKEIFKHLTDCIKKVLEERPENATDVFEDISRKVKKEDGDTRPQPSTEKSLEFGIAQIEKKLFPKKEKEDDDTPPEDENESPFPPLSLITFFYEQAGIGLSQTETYRVWMALKDLVNNQPIDKARFWGKILGTEQDYYIAEVELREGEELEDEEEEQEEEADAGAAVADDMDEDEEGKEEEDKPPKSNWKPPPTIPKEEFRTGVNKKLYFVCNTPGSEWVRLPQITPIQIQAARKTIKLFTGRLDAEVKSAEKFPGTEMILLRAQIARISAGTQISPSGYLTMGGEEEEEAEEGEEGIEPIKNEEYEPLHPQELLDLSEWKHHTKHILPQGRTKWWNPSEKREDEFEEEDEDEDVGEGEGVKAIEPEIGPPIMTPISEDAPVEGLIPWSLRLSSKRMKEYGVVVASSNLWPGAHAFSYGKHCENIYIGWGYKTNQSNHAPLQTEPTESEYKDGKEIEETVDPTPEEEAAAKKKDPEGEEALEEEEMEEEEDN